MAIDGSFCLHAELDRFLARCPNLRCINTFTSLLEKGTMLAEDKLVDSVAALFLHSTYTIPVIGCFRPVAGKILDKVVESLRLVSNLGSNIGGAVEDSHGNQTHLDFEDVDGVEASNIIDFYSKTGRGLDLHERACFAFCRALDLVPSLKGHVECYYDFAPPPFIRIPELMPKFKCSAKDAVHLLHIVRISYRTLLAEPEYFSSRWNWCCFLDLVQNSEDCSLDDDDTKLGKNVSGISWSGSDAVSDIIWCAGQILSVVLKLPNKTIASSGLNEEDGLACLLRWHEFCCDSSLEKAGWHSVEANKLESSDGDTCFHEEDDTNILSSKLLKIEPLKRGRRVEKRDISGDCSPFVITSAVKKSYERVVLAVHQKWPVLLCGPGGSGKTALVKKLALDSGNRVLFIHMDEQIDGRMLIGSYVCTEQPGEFRWQPGSLTQAAMNGLWVVFENIDQALSDVQSILLPLLEGGRSIVTGHGETIKVAEGFRLFSTISSCKPDVSPSIEGRNSLSALWRRVMVRSPSSRDLIDVVTAWYPDLEPIAEKVSATFESVNQLSRSCSGISGVPNTVNRFSTRDLLRWCKRFSGSGFTFKRDDLTASMRTIIFLEAVDIFSASSGSLGNRHTIVESIAKMWDVSVPLVDTLRRLDKPIFRDSPTELQIGRITLQCPQVSHRHQNKPFVAIRSSLHALERIACSVKWNEPVLLVGETGTGKTTLIQSLATRLGHRLTVLNLSQQSDVADLLGGFKPVDPQSICIPLFKEFEDLFSRTFPSEENKPFLASLAEQFRKKNWEKVLRRFGKGVEMVVRIKRHGSGLKRKRPVAKEVLNAWKKFALKVEIVHRQVAASSGMLFSFVEGAFVTSLRNGDWILLDEVNLAPPETLQRIVGVLDGENGSLCLAERGDIEYLYRHPNFRIFACMNPATDAGKRDLPYSLRSRFTEYFIDDVLDDDDLTLFVSQFIDDSHVEQDLVNKIVHFYKAVKKEAEERLQDGANQKPQYSLRSLYRALEYAREARRRFEFQDALYDGFCLLFMTSLDKPSSKIMNGMIVSKLLGKPPCDIPFEEYLAKVLKPPKGRSQDAPISRQKIQIHMKLEDVGNYVLTESVRKHLKNLARAMLIRRYPVLLQGPTSGGKTSLVKYLAAITGHEFVRINNHEHTDLQEYLGSYITDVSGKLVFQEGALVKAIRNGHWIVLDELNLAPSDVLEALNRLLDDNRELFVPELSETICAHPDFMLFATQNPPIIYGGRKMLSRAFRNRFIEIHVDEIPEDELSTILMNRCKIAGSYAKKMVKVMRELQLLRQSSKMFAGKHGFITPRDLFRWADRFMTDGRSYDDLARDGYLLLAERLRDENEKSVVQEVLERHLHVRILKDELYKQGLSGMADESLSSANSENIVWTGSMWRLYFLVERCYRMREPVLLVGETGGGKTTVCQLLSSILQSKLHILNCHQYTETSDFIGGFYPVRERSRIMLEFTNLIEQILSSKAFTHFPMDGTISSDINQASSTLHKLGEISNSYKGVGTHSPLSNQDLVSFEQMRQHLSQLHQKWQTIFTWQDGPLVQAMKNGDLFLVDEISLADDSVLERLNSILEPERKLSLAEKGGSDLEKITAHRNFFLLATMNPGGDYGKKELSPALRNRFTEIWVPPVSDLDELRSIAVKRFSSSELHALVDPMLSFWEWFNQLQTGRVLTVRDLLSWVAFINTTKGSLQPDYAFLHGAFLVLLDGISLGTSISKNEAAELRRKCLDFLLLQLKGCTFTFLNPEISCIENYGWGNLSMTEDISWRSDMQLDNSFGIHPFYIKKGHDKCEVGEFEFLAPTTHRNVLRVLRAVQVAKPVLLEGSPGVGKTSLIVALGKFSGHKVVRINLSEQTDMMDLLGSDLPVESEEGMQFAWSDGILLQALKEGSWILLDELNLAPQSVLEGLNAILDHRAEVFIPELGLSFKCPPSFRVFACQNPSYQGGGRKGLPKSFLNRFTKVYVDELAEDDYQFICRSLFPSIPRSTLTKLIQFNKRLYEETMLHRRFAQNGAPWEFNLRDVIRSCQIIQGSPDKSECHSFLNVVYVQRMRTDADRREVLELYQHIFGVKPSINPYPRVQLNGKFLVVGNACIKRNNFQSTETLCTELKILPDIRNSLEAAVQCVQQQWLCILIGQTSCGKTSLVRLLAQLTGNVLNEINLSSSTDTSDLIGCFEQFNAFRNFQSVVAQVDRYVKEYCSQNLEPSLDRLLRERKGLIAQWLSSSSKLNFDHVSRSCSTDDEKWSSSLSVLVEIIEYLRRDMDRNMSPISWSHDDLDKILQRIRKLQEVQYGRPSSAKFGWVAGLLIKAMEHGEWVLLEDANLCNPTVLDRINSLAESNGSITVNECGNVDGKPLILHPHPDFRMFLTVNPSYGEVSRAMRNRGVEIAMMKPYWLFEKEGGYRSKKIELNDVKRFLVLSNIPRGLLIDSMAKAHLYARDEGLRLNVDITYRELARWIQLFQQLLTSGNHLLWSLQRSWEHTYISSFGEYEGWDIVNHAKISYLSVKPSSSLEWSLCLPGGWPLPLKLRDFVWYSNETFVRQNCMYLESLGSQYASFERSLSQNQDLSLCLSAESLKAIYLMDSRMLQQIINPKYVNACSSSGSGGLDLALAGKMLLFSADWTVEQATENDLKLYLLWFSWFNSQLQPYCEVFGSYLALFRKELQHPIWECIFHSRRELMSHQGLDHCLQSLPILALESVDLVESKGKSVSSVKLLHNAINCVGLLRRSLWQWNAERMHAFTDQSQQFKPLLKSLRILEEEVLKMIVKSPSFDFLFRTYNDLLEEHISWWNSIVASQLDHQLVHLSCLIKNVMKLQDYCPQEVKFVAVESRNLNCLMSWSLNSPKSMLWAYGGHPLLPGSADVYYKLQQLFHFSELLSPLRIVLHKPAGVCPVETAVSTNSELRLLAMQGVSMASHILDKCNEDESYVVNEFDQIYQMLLRRFEHEKEKLEANVDSEANKDAMAYSTSCCILFPEIICTPSGFGSWLGTVAMVDQTSLFLDLSLLQELSRIAMAGGSELQSALSGLSDDLQSTMHFSLNFSSRSPSDLLPHQKLLWILDACASVDGADTKISSYIIEMWFRWHSFLWNGSSVFAKGFPRDDARKFLLPDMISMPIKLEIVQHILEINYPMKDYPVHCLKIRVASCILWQSFMSGINLHSSFLSIVRSLLQQIILAHRKSFHPEQYAAIKSIYLSLQENMIKESDIQAMVSLLMSSTHQKFTSLIGPFIEPLLKEVYLLSSSDSLYSLGCAWLRLGALRFHLLIGCDDVDPAVKYTSKYLQLVEKISSLELEMKVRQECDYLAGSLSKSKAEDRRCNLFEKLEVERRRVQKKIIFRGADRGKFKKLKHECDEFLKLISPSLLLLGSAKHMELQHFINQASNWQVTANSFINRLSDEYTEYVDIIQPLQVAVYEMKLGLSLVVSCVLQRDFLSSIQEGAINPILDAIYSFMRFPDGPTFRVSVEINLVQPEVPLYTLSFAKSGWAEKMGLLEKLIPFIDSVDSMKMVSLIHLKAPLYQSLLARAVNFVSTTQLLDNAIFMMTDQIFSYFANIWMDMKVQVKTKKDNDAQQFKFRPREFKMEDICEIDLSSMSDSFASDTFLEWKEILHEEDTVKVAPEEHENSQEWNFIPESALNNMVHIHSQLFGSTNLVETPGVVQVSDTDRLLSFIESYTLGAKMVKGLNGISSSYLDAKLCPEHTLRICLEHQLKLPNSDKSAHVYNFYKDSNVSAIAGMVKLLIALQERVLFLFNKRNEHAGLHKILDVIQMLLALPSTTPLAKALSGLQFLFGRIKMLHEEGFKLPLNDELEPVLTLAHLWQKMEYDSWHYMLDEVKSQFEMNAAKLWLPLYSVLHHRTSKDIAEYKQYTVQSLEEFIWTSNLGEFQKRLKLILAFHGQISAGISLKSYTSPFQMENRKILYNVFGFYVQCLPIIMEHIDASRRNIEKELQQLLKLCQWERSEKLLSIENSKRNRQKMKKLIQKYTDALQQPVMLVLNQEVVARVVKMKNPGDSSDKDKQMLMAAQDLPHLGDINRAQWYTSWQAKVDSALQNSHQETESIVKKCVVSKSASPAYHNEWNKTWDTLEKICRTAADSREIWQGEGKTLVKKRALADLLKLLENSGLSRHKSKVLQDQFEDIQSNWWFFLPSYNVSHLLLKRDSLLLGKTSNDAPNQAVSPMNESFEDEWKGANEYYFKSLASVQHLQQICVNIHKDFRDPSDKVQVEKASSFLQHLIAIQQGQRAAAYDFSQSINQLTDCVSSLCGVYRVFTSSCQETISELSTNQHALIRCMWHQKEVFDSLCALSHEETLLLRTVKGVHMDNCQNVGAAANRMLALLEAFFPSFRKSKAKLDEYLLGNGVRIKIATSMRPLLISKEMELFLIQNVEVLKEFQEHLRAFRGKDINRSSVEDTLIRHFEDIIEKVKAIEKELHTSAESGKDSRILPQKRKSSTIMHGDDNCSAKNLSEYEDRFNLSVDNIYRNMTNTFQKLGCWSKSNATSEESMEEITSWKDFFQSLMADLQLDYICEELDRVVFYAGKLADLPRLSSHVTMQFKHLQLFLDLIFAFGDGILHDFVAAHKKVALMTHTLAENFASLFSEGYGTPVEEQVDDNEKHMTQDASGTGMGEGAGVKDVSDQISDEDQLLGASGKREEDASEEVPSKNDKGIEMEQDFEADAFSVSEDSAGDDDDDGEGEEDEQLESAMGKTGDDSEIVDEKHWDKEDDGNSDGINEKYESGPSVKDGDLTGRELRAKEDSAAMPDDLEEGDPNKSDANNEVDPSKNAADSTENFEMIDKEDAIGDPMDMELDEHNQIPEDTPMEIKPSEDPLEGTEDGENDEHMNGKGAEEMTGPTDEISEEADPNQVGERAEEDAMKGDEENGTADLTKSGKDVFGQGNSSFMEDHLPVTEAAAQPMDGPQEALPRYPTPEEKWSFNSGMQNDLAPSDNASQMEIMLGNSSKGEKLADIQPESQVPQQDLSSLLKNQPNPMRNVGDALEAWKERVRVSADLHDNDRETLDDMVDGKADEYGFTSEFEKGIAQALGPAMPDQVEQKIDGDKPDGDPAVDKNNSMERELQREDTEVQQMRSHAIVRSKVEERIQIPNLEKLSEERILESRDSNDNDSRMPMESFVSLNKSYMSKNMDQLSKLSINDLGKADKLVEVSADLTNKAGAIWRKYELQTTMLSQELAEQLRLVMEPTVASKLQGDFRTGKRINMKKVIPYIASHYRKDKIWLRRTRPNKRDYQVVIAVDDSRSMSESHCGDVAIEALVTVCRAMSQLEVGKFAVASFGRKGNIRLLHDFDRPFTGEAGIKMISSLTFRQENTITDEPMVDLLTYLNNMLDEAVASARLPSGQNPLQQLVLIIADGRFHEKEKLRRYVRDALNRKRMVAFLLLDSPEESIMDLMEASFEGGNMRFSKYLDSFPFPYYIVLRNVEALPRTLADLLRQWFELTQYSRD